MNTTGYGSQDFVVMLRRFRPRRGLVFGSLIVVALIAFEIFNYSTTDFALSDLLGDLRFLGVRWATILAIAFSGIDFAGIARLFTPEEGVNEPAEVWYLFGAWMLAATMNAMLTWWGVSLAVLNHQTLGNAVVERQTLLQVVPIFVAVLVWLIRVLIIGTFSVAGDRLFSQVSDDQQVHRGRVLNPARPSASSVPPLTRPKPASIPLAAAYRGAKSVVREEEEEEPEEVYTRPASTNGNGRTRPYQRPPSPTDSGYSRGEPTYHPVAMEGRRRDGNGNGNSQLRR